MDETTVGCLPTTATVCSYYHLQLTVVWFLPSPYLILLPFGTFARTAFMPVLWTGRFCTHHGYPPLTCCHYRQRLDLCSLRRRILPIFPFGDCLLLCMGLQLPAPYRFCTDCLGGENLFPTAFEAFLCHLVLFLCHLPLPPFCTHRHFYLQYRQSCLHSFPLPACRKGSPSTLFLSSSSPLSLSPLNPSPLSLLSSSPSSLTGTVRHGG